MIDLSTSNWHHCNSFTWSALISLGRLRKRSILPSSCHGLRMNLSPWTTWIWLSGKYSSQRFMCAA